MWYGPAATAATPLVNPLTATGVSRFAVVPSPSWPRLFNPQHCTTPLLVSAQVWLPPAATATTPLASPLTVTGVNRGVVVPSPNWP